MHNTTHEPAPIECRLTWPSRFGGGPEHRCQLAQDHEGPHECSCGAQKDA